MKKVLGLLVLTVLVVSVMPGVVLALSVGVNSTPDIGTLDFAPEIWLCDNRVVLDDATAPGRLAGAILYERINNYAFEGEQIQWTVLVMDSNGITTVTDVVGTAGASAGIGNPIEVSCVPTVDPDFDLDAVANDVDDTCNARVDNLILGDGDFDSNTMEYYICTFTVETPLSMYGEYWISAEAIDSDMESNVIDENEFWFFNPVIALTIEGDITFTDVRPGTMAYSTTLNIGNDADAGSGVLLDMFISGTDFYDSTGPATCPTSNELLLGNGDSDCDVSAEFGGTDPTTDPFCYFAGNGGYSTQGDGRRDNEGYIGINYAVGFNNPNPFYGLAAPDNAGYEIIQDTLSYAGSAPYYASNLLTPGSEMSITFRLALPSPCNGDFDTGDISFWGEAI